ncbi:UNVERIFIED_ORG: dihydrofolate synthase/folylpolyglutamate synthase [Actinomadura viridilutea]|nr:hypothetical protein [Actinomadura rubrobrunea]
MARSEGAADAEEVFFREWRARRPGQTRDVARARRVADLLGVGAPRAPVLAVVGSKGKGTAATYASACLAAAGWRVCTVTSPGLRGNTDRIRVDGRAVDVDVLGALAARLEEALRRMPPPDRGYLSPAGLFTIAGAVHAHEAGADALVLEAAMGGRSDEAALFAPAVVAITPIFGEHLGVLGDTVEAIAAEKAGAVAPGTRAVVSAPQEPAVAEVLDGVVAARTGGGAAVEYMTGDGVDAPAAALPDGLGRVSALVGVAAGLRLLRAVGAPGPPRTRLRDVLASVRLPGRLSWHRLPGADTDVLADAAIDGVGVAAAVDAARARWGGIDHALVCLPDHKDLDGAAAALGSLPVTFVRLPYAHLRFTRPLPPHWTVIDASALTRRRVAALGRRVVAVGTVYFVGLVLDLVDADTERLFTAG